MGSKLYFFKQDKYARYDIASNRIDDGYPLSIGDSWPGMRDAGFADAIDAAVNWDNGKVYFFKGDQYIRYDVEADRVDDGYPLSIADDWPGMREAGFADAIDAAINWDNGKVYFFKGSNYVRYDVQADHVDDGYPSPIAENWRGMAAAGFSESIESAVNGQNGSIYFFKDDKYVRYNIAGDTVDDGYPLLIGDQWPGMVSIGFGGGVKAAIAPRVLGKRTSLTADLSDQFFAKMKTVSTALGCHPIHLSLVMYSESGLKASALNPNGKAAGISQLMPATLRALGWTDGPEAYVQLDAANQLSFVEKFYKPHVALGLSSLGRLYQLNFLPATAKPGQNNSTVLAERGGMNSDAYANNPILDRDKDGKITIGDLEATALVRRNDPRWKEIESRL